MFQFVHQHNLVYNTCWEDPRLDRVALGTAAGRHGAGHHLGGLQRPGLRPGGAQRVIAVDLNPRQNALLELKLAGIRSLRYEDFFAMFGCGRLDQAGKIYGQALRPALSPWAQAVLGPMDRVLRAGKRCAPSITAAPAGRSPCW